MTRYDYEGSSNFPSCNGRGTLMTVATHPLLLPIATYNECPSQSSPSSLRFSVHISVHTSLTFSMPPSTPSLSHFSIIPFHRPLPRVFSSSTSSACSAPYHFSGK